MFRCKMSVLVLLLSLLPLSAIAYSTNTLPTNQDLYDINPFGLLYYHGQTVSNALGTIFIGKFDHWPEQIQSVELDYTLDRENPIRRLLSPIVGVVQIAGDATVRHGSNEHTIYEFDPYLNGRWANFPWNNVITTSLAAGEGVSYDSSVSALEAKSSHSTKRFLNFLMFEATFALPAYPNWQLVARIHHRSGAYGVYRAGNTGSNDVGVGIRYLF